MDNSDKNLLLLLLLLLSLTIIIVLLVSSCIIHNKQWQYNNSFCSRFELWAITELNVPENIRSVSALNSVRQERDRVCGSLPVQVIEGVIKLLLLFLNF